MLSDMSIQRPMPPTLRERIAQKLRAKLSKTKRKKINVKYANEILNKDFTIISSNCMGGMLYHDIGMPFLSPTVNTAFDGEDFCKFCENLPFYLDQEITEVETDLVTYPVGRISDVEVRFVHYKTFDEARRKWIERSGRVNYDKILIMATDRDGMVNYMERFDCLPYPKIMYTSVDYPEYDWAVYCPKFKNRKCVGIMTGVANFRGERFYEENISLIDFINLTKQCE